MTDHIQLSQTLWVCSFLPGSCASLQIYGWWQAKRSHGRSSWKVYISQHRSPRVASQELSTSLNYNSPNWYYSNQWKSQHSTTRSFLLLAPNGKLKTFSISLCCSCTHSTATALWHLVSFFQDETERLSSSVLLLVLTHSHQASYWGKPCVYLQIWLACALQPLCPSSLKTQANVFHFRHSTWPEWELNCNYLLHCYWDLTRSLSSFYTFHDHKMVKTASNWMLSKWEGRTPIASVQQTISLLRKVATEIIAWMVMFFFVKNTARVTRLGFSKQKKPHRTSVPARTCLFESAMFLLCSGCPLKVTDYVGFRLHQA